MDPVGVSLAIVSLTFQVFSGCVKGYQLLSDARGMPQEYQYLRVRLKTEQYRLLDWAYVAQLDVNDEDLLISNASKGLLIDVLDQQDRLLKKFGRFDDKYRPLRHPLISDDVDLAAELGAEKSGHIVHAGGAEIAATASPPAYDEAGLVAQGVERTDTFQRRFPQSEVLLKKALDWAKTSRTYPARLKWASWDKAKVEGLLLKLSTLNDFMRELLNSNQLQSLAVKQTRTEFQIMQLNGKIDQLVQIFESALTLSGSKARSRADAQGVFLKARGQFDSTYDDHVQGKDRLANLQNLAALAQAKALNLTIEDQSLLTDSLAKDLELGPSASDIKSVELERKDIHILDEETRDPLAEFPRVEAYYTSSSNKRRIKQSVWIEWKIYEPVIFNGGPDPKILERIRALATLLKERSRTDQFHAPHCLGYFHDIDLATGEDRCRFGLVFEKPHDVHPSTPPISLLELLRISAAEIPSLTDRIALMTLLAECVERLHAVNWLHKGLCSQNVLFFSGDSAAVTAALQASKPGASGGSGSNGTSSSHCLSDLLASIDFSQPYISGFDYSRPAANEEMTERPPENAAYDIYRHPRVQGSGNCDPPPVAQQAGGGGGGAGSQHHQSAGVHTGFKKSYDLYSLGVIFLEIAYWSPIDVVLDIPDLANTRPNTTLKVRQRLLQENHLAFVKSRLGNTVEGAVRACLQGPAALGVGDEEDERLEEVGARLQKGFFEQVVGRLQGVRV